MTPEAIVALPDRVETISPFTLMPAAPPIDRDLDYLDDTRAHLAQKIERLRDLHADALTQLRRYDERVTAFSTQLAALTAAYNALPR